MADDNRILSAPPGGTGPSLEEFINQSGFTPQQMEMMEMIMNDFPGVWEIDELQDIFLSIDSQGTNAGDEMFTELYGGSSAMQGTEMPTTSPEMATAMETKGALPLGATGVVEGRDGGRIVTGGVPSLQDMRRDDMMEYDPPDLRKQEEILMRSMTER